MATPEYEQTGSTSGQRLFAERQTEPRLPPGRPPSQFRAVDAFVDSIFERSPGLMDFERELQSRRAGTPALPSPAASPYEDLSTSEIISALRRLSGQPSTMDPTLAEQVSRDLNG